MSFHLVGVGEILHNYSVHFSYMQEEYTEFGQRASDLVKIPSYGRPHCYVLLLYHLVTNMILIKPAKQALIFLINF